MPDVRLIDANALKKAFATDMRIVLFDGTRQGAGGFLVQRYQVVGLIDEAPTVDAVPVVHGRWEKVKVWKDNPQTTLKCSICKVYQPIYEHDEWLYCPFCGAKMDGGAEDGNR